MSVVRKVNILSGGNIECPTYDLIKHIFNYFRSKTCPQCRNKCSDKSFHRIYFNILNSGDISLDAGALQHQVDSLKLQIDEKETNKRTIELQLVKIQNDNKKYK